MSYEECYRGHRCIYLAVRALARAGHTVYSTMRETTGRNAPQVKEVKEYAGTHSVDLYSIELDVLSQDGAEVINAVADRIRAEFLRRIGLGDLLVPKVNN
jgi:hypothetical protein